MIRLASSEFLRLRSRRLVWVLVVLLLGGVALGVGIGGVKSEPATSAETAQAAAAYRTTLARCMNGSPAAAGVGPGQTLDQVCRDDIRLENFEPSHQLRLSQLASTVKGTAFLLVVFGLVVGASSVGADFQAGSMATLLTWESRRLRVLLVRAVVVVVVMFALVVALESVLSAVFAAAAWSRGSTTVSPGWFGELAGVIVRIGVLAAAMAAIGLAIAAIGRNTAAALGGVFVYLALIESVLRGFVPDLDRFMLSVNAVVVVTGQPTDAGGNSLVTVAWASVAVALYVVVSLAVAAATFRARDMN